MPTTVAELMAREPETVSADTSIGEAARRMRDSDVGDVIVVDGERLVGIVTDRDIVVRAVAEGREHSTPLRDVCSSEDLATVSPDTPAEEAAVVMRTQAVRRLPVTEGDRLVGVVSIGDLAIERDEGSALADISSVDPNR